MLPTLPSPGYLQGRTGTTLRQARPPEPTGLCQSTPDPCVVNTNSKFLPKTVQKTVALGRSHYPPGSVATRHLVHIPRWKTGPHATFPLLKGRSLTVWWETGPFKGHVHPEDPKMNQREACPRGGTVQYLLSACRKPTLCLLSAVPTPCLLPSAC